MGFVYSAGYFLLKKGQVLPAKGIYKGGGYKNSLWGMGG